MGYVRVWGRTLCSQSFKWKCVSCHHKSGKCNDLRLVIHEWNIGSLTLADFKSKRTIPLTWQDCLDLCVQQGSVFQDEKMFWLTFSATHLHSGKLLWWKQLSCSSHGPWQTPAPHSNASQVWPLHEAFFWPLCDPTETPLVPCAGITVPHSSSTTPH